MPISTVKVTRKSDGCVQVINEEDFNKELYEVYKEPQVKKVVTDSPASRTRHRETIKK